MTFKCIPKIKINFSLGEETIITFRLTNYNYYCALFINNNNNNNDNTEINYYY